MQTFWHRFCFSSLTSIGAIFGRADYGPVVVATASGVGWGASVALAAADKVLKVECPMNLILLIILILLLLGALPTWPYSRGWGYYPSGGLGLVVIILIILLLMGRI